MNVIRLTNHRTGRPPLAAARELNTLDHPGGLSMKKICWSVLISFLCIQGFSAARAEELPTVIETFNSLMKEDSLNDVAVEKVASLISFPIEVDENAYEPGGDWCHAHSRITKFKSIKELGPVLARMQENWKRLNPPSQFNDQRTYGVSESGDCEHVWSVKLNESGSKIVRIELDAEDTWWSKDRKDFK